MKRKKTLTAILFLFFAALPFPADCRFLEILPSVDIVPGGSAPKVDVDLVFSYPEEKDGVPPMVPPEQFFVLHDDKKMDLKTSLVPMEMKGKSAYRLSYVLKNPGDYIFSVAAAPYWDPAEEKLIVQYAKVVVNGFERKTERWNEPVRFPVEIDPLVRPYGLWTGNSFRGIVKHNGRPVPFADIEVAYRSSKGEVIIPAGPFRTQILVADINGVFSYTMPRAGWWGFAARIEGEMVEHEGRRVEVELDGLIWVRCVDMETK